MIDDISISCSTVHVKVITSVETTRPGQGEYSFDTGLGLENQKKMT